MSSPNDKNRDKKAPKKLTKIKSSVFSRGLSLAKLTVNAGASLASHNIKKTFSNDTEADKKSWGSFVKSQAEVISNELGELKGSLMKAGQMLSMYGEHFLPPEANDFLKNLQADSPALAWEAIEPVLKKNLNKALRDQLDIDPEALACASLGQVHRARIKATGEQIVLKIQYPDVDKAIDSDLRALRTLLGVMKLVPKDLDLDPLFKEINEMLIQETNYVIEAQRTMEFYEKLKHDPRFVVPKVHAQFSNKTILATSYEEGVRVDSAEVAALPQARRNQIGMNYMDLYFQELFVWRTVQTDPHIGNYKIRLGHNGHDQIVLYDFGATREYPESFMQSYRHMIKGAVLGDEVMFRKAATELKFIHPEDDPDLRALFEEFCFETVEPFMEPDDPRLPPNAQDANGNYDWKNSDLPQRASQKVMKVLKKYSWRAPPREIIFLDRKTGGVFIFMGVLRAKCRVRDVMQKYLTNLAD
jgi:predicted unusual protein kinase regulating ubiquinone biosynthesis (AarF/ABC1/UbiB family)